MPAVRRPLRTAPLLLLLVLVPALAGCEFGGSRDLDAIEEPVDRDSGRQLFQQTCRVCHSLADANAAGTFGPDLDQLQPDANRTREQIGSGGGGMPSDLLDGDKADLVARYVGEVAGEGLPPEEQSGGRGSTRTTPEASPSASDPAG